MAGHLDVVIPHHLDIPGDINAAGFERTDDHHRRHIAVGKHAIKHQACACLTLGQPAVHNGTQGGFAKEYGHTQAFVRGHTGFPVRPQIAGMTQTGFRVSDVAKKSNPAATPRQQVLGCQITAKLVVPADLRVDRIGKIGAPDRQVNAVHGQAVEVHVPGQLANHHQPGHLAAADHGLHLCLSAVIEPGQQHIAALCIQRIGHAAKQFQDEGIRNRLHAVAQHHHPNR
ncbi:MAG: hypothetical protein ACD_23C00707G0001, partial [uncultured bacterium]